MAGARAGGVARGCIPAPRDPRPWPLPGHDARVAPATRDPGLYPVTTPGSHRLTHTQLTSSQVNEFKKGSLLGLGSPILTRCQFRHRRGQISLVRCYTDGCDELYVVESWSGGAASQAAGLRWHRPWPGRPGLRSPLHENLLLKCLNRQRLIAPLTPPSLARVVTVTAPWSPKTAIYSS